MSALDYGRETAETMPDLPVCPRCKWQIPAPFLEKQSASVRCSRCGFRLRDTIREYAQKQLEANAPAKGVGEEVLDKTGFPIWILMLIVGCVGVFGTLVYMTVQNDRQIDSEFRAEEAHKAELAKFRDDLNEMLDTYAALNSSSTPLAVGDAIDGLTHFLETPPESPDDETLQVVSQAEDRIEALIQLYAQMNSTTP